MRSVVRSSASRTLKASWMADKAMFRWILGFLRKRFAISVVASRRTLNQDRPLWTNTWGRTTGA